MDESQIPQGFAKPKEDRWAVIKVMVCLVSLGFLGWLAYNYVYLPSSGG